MRDAIALQLLARALLPFVDQELGLAIFGFNRAGDAALQANEVVARGGYNVFVCLCGHRVVKLSGCLSVASLSWACRQRSNRGCLIHMKALHAFVHLGNVCVVGLHIACQTHEVGHFG